MENSRNLKEIITNGQHRQDTKPVSWVKVLDVIFSLLFLKAHLSFILLHVNQKNCISIVENPQPHNAWKGSHSLTFSYYFTQNLCRLVSLHHKKHIFFLSSLFVHYHIWHCKLLPSHSSSKRKKKKTRGCSAPHNEPIKPGHGFWQWFVNNMANGLSLCDCTD